MSDCVLCASGLGKATDLQRGEHGVCLAHYSYYYRTLLYCFLCVLNLEDTTLWRADRREQVAFLDQMLDLQCDGIVVVIVPEHGCGGPMIELVAGYNRIRELSNDPEDERIEVDECEDTFVGP